MFPPALFHAGFRRYFLGSLLNVNAVWIQRTTLGWLAWDLTGSSAYVGITAGLSLLPSFVLGPVFGVWVDRAEIRRAAQLTLSAMVAILLVLIALYAADGLTRPSLLAIAFGLGVATSAYQPVRLSLAPRLVPSELMSGVIALTALNFNVARLIAPVIAGLLIASVGVFATLIVAVLLLLPLIFIIPTLSPRPLPKVTGRHPGLGVAFREGVSHARSVPVIFRCILLAAAFTFAARGVLELLPVIADGLFSRGAEGLGLLIGAAGAGALVAALVLTSFTAKSKTGGVPASTVVGLVASQLLVSAIAVVPTWPMMLATIALLGGTATYVSVSIQTLIQARLADEMRGRVMSLWVMTNFGMAAFGSFAIGAAAQVIGIGMASALSGALGLVLVIAILVAPKGSFSRPGPV